MPIRAIDHVQLAMPKGRDAGMAYLRQFVETAKADGLVSAAIARAGLRGARIGVIRKFFDFSDGFAPLMENLLEVMKREGAVLIDPVEIDSIGKFDKSELDAMLYEFKADLNAYLAAAGSKVPVHSLKEIIEFNERNRAKEMPFFGQDLMLKSEAKGPLTEPVRSLKLPFRSAAVGTEMLPVEIPWVVRVP